TRRPRAAALMPASRRSLRSSAPDSRRVIWLSILLAPVLTIWLTLCARRQGQLRTAQGARPHPRHQRAHLLEGGDGPLAPWREERRQRFTAEQVVSEQVCDGIAHRQRQFARHLQAQEVAHAGATLELLQIQVKRVQERHRSLGWVRAHTT